MRREAFVILLIPVILITCCLLLIPQENNILNTCKGILVYKWTNCGLTNIIYGIIELACIGLATYVILFRKLYKALFRISSTLSIFLSLIVFLLIIAIMGTTAGKAFFLLMEHAGKQPGVRRLLINILNKQKENYDFCVIDAPPSPGILSLNILVASDKIVIPVNAAAFSLQGVQSLNRIIDEVKVDNPTLMIQGILITRSNPMTNLNKDVTEVLKEMAKTINTRLFETTIRQGVAIETAQAGHLDFFTAAPKSGVAKDHDGFIDEFLGEKT